MIVFPRLFSSLILIQFVAGYFPEIGFKMIKIYSVFHQQMQPRPQPGVYNADPQRREQSVFYAPNPAAQVTFNGGNSYQIQQSSYRQGPVGTHQTYTQQQGVPVYQEMRVVNEQPRFTYQEPVVRSNISGSVSPTYQRVPYSQYQSHYTRQVPVAHYQGQVKAPYAEHTGQEYQEIVAPYQSRMSYRGSASRTQHREGYKQTKKGGICTPCCIGLLGLLLLAALLAGLFFLIRGINAGNDHHEEVKREEVDYIGTHEPYIQSKAEAKVEKNEDQQVGQEQQAGQMQAKSEGKVDANAAAQTSVEQQESTGAKQKFGIAPIAVKPEATTTTATATATSSSSGASTVAVEPNSVKPIKVEPSVAGESSNFVTVAPIGVKPTATSTEEINPIIVPPKAVNTQFQIPTKVSAAGTTQTTQLTASTATTGVTQATSSTTAETTSGTTAETTQLTAATATTGATQATTGTTATQTTIGTTAEKTSITATTATTGLTQNTGIAVSPVATSPLTQFPVTMVSEEYTEPSFEGVDIEPILSKPVAVDSKTVVAVEKDPEENDTSEETEQETVLLEESAEPIMVSPIPKTTFERH